MLKRKINTQIIYVFFCFKGVKDIQSVQMSSPIINCEKKINLPIKEFFCQQKKGGRDWTQICEF